MSAKGIDEPLETLRDLGIDTTEAEVPSEWEQRFETQITNFFNEAQNRIPGFVDRHLTSFKQVMKRSLAPKTGLGDVMVSAQNMLAGVSSALGGPDFSRDTYTHEELTEAFEREVISPDELELLLSRLFREFEEEMWAHVEQQVHQAADDDPPPVDADILRERILELTEEEIAHDPLLAQVIRSGVRIGLPASLGYVLFGRLTLTADAGTEAASQVYEKRLDLYHRALHQLGRFQIPGWMGAVGFAGGLVGTLAVGGLVEYTLNNVRDIKGFYIRQLNAAKHALLYGDDPESPEGQGVLHLVRGLERQFDDLAEMTRKEVESGDGADLGAALEVDSDTNVDTDSDTSTDAPGSTPHPKRPE